MRYESKLRVLKRASRHGDFKILVRQYQRNINIYYVTILIMVSHFFQRDIEVGPTNCTATLSEDAEFATYLNIVQSSEQLVHPKFTY